MKIHIVPFSYLRCSSLCLCCCVSFGRRKNANYVCECIKVISAEQRFSQSNATAEWSTGKWYGKAFKLTPSLKLEHNQPKMYFEKKQHTNNGNNRTRNRERRVEMLGILSRALPHILECHFIYTEYFFFFSYPSECNNSECMWIGRWMDTVVSWWHFT